MMTFADLDAFRAHIQAAFGLELLGELRADGEFHGLATTEDRHGARPFRYCAHLDYPQNVYFCDFKRNISGTWFVQEQAALDPAERERRRREFEARKLEREAATQERHTKAAARALALWRTAKPASPVHPYLIRKGVGVHGLRCLPCWERRIYHSEPFQGGGAFELVSVENALLVPMRDGNGAIWNVQAIFPEPCPQLGRDKDFLSGGRKKGLFHWIGQRTGTVCLCEGYATAASVHEATGYRVVVCFDAGNLPDVAGIVRGLLPDARLVICADHDAPDKNGRRAGQEKAEEAAARVGGFVAMAPIEGDDFNDWAKALKGGKDV